MSMLSTRCRSIAACTSNACKRRCRIALRPERVEPRSASLLAVHLLDEMLAVDNAPEMEVEDVVCLGERSWA